MVFRSGPAPFTERQAAEVMYIPALKAVVSANGREVPPDVQVTAPKDLAVPAAP